MSMPPAYPVKLPFVPTTLWHGIIIEIGLCPTAPPTACADTNYMSHFELPGTFAPICSYELLKKATDKAEELGVVYSVGNIYSTDVFYSKPETTPKWQEMGVMAVEMEAAALYANAAKAGKNALAICTISDNLITGESTDAETRQKTFTQMMEIALEIA